MRERLHDEGLVHEALEGTGLVPGRFVELPMRLEKSPLLESVETLVSLTGSRRSLRNLRRRRPALKVGNRGATAPERRLK
jgi:hypothetical protein